MKRVHYIILAVTITVIALGVVSALVIARIIDEEYTQKQTSIEGTGQKVEVPATTTTQPQLTYRCPLDDEATTVENGQRRPLAVMIENHPDARPQSGLIKACTVYETVAEGGVTRFMAIFLHNDIPAVGPVRSAREYFVDLAKQYDAIYSHCGGPATIYTVLKNLAIADLDEMANGDAYWRLKTRRAPHNLYSSTKNLWAKAVAKGYSSQVFFQKPNFKDDASLSERPAVASIDINFSRPDFAVHYEYDRQTNTYKRFMAGKAHMDGVYELQIAPKNVVVQFNPIGPIANDPKGRMKVSLAGMGKATVFQDGQVIQATWQRPALADLTRYYDQSGTEIRFNSGQTWIEIVDPSTMQVTYK
ncbi:MAG TPA: DUF3048 domain-containing protein [Candidatus Aquicultor sp.]|jgi:hypothetical protein